MGRSSGPPAVDRTPAVSNSRGPLKLLKVAVVGAGAAGLVAAREFLKEGHSVTVFEQSRRVGGVWNYTNEVEEASTSGTMAEDRRRVHSSLYKSLRTNLPRHVMAFLDFPFNNCLSGRSDNALYCGHQEVLAYLEKFAEHFELSRWIRFSTRVTKASPEPQAAICQHPFAGPRWTITTQPTEGEEASTETFDALVVCNGHYAEPRFPDIARESAGFPGRLLHTHNYRENSSFADEIVVVIGGAFSGKDISLEISEVAEKVYICCRAGRFQGHEWSWENTSTPTGPRRNIWQRQLVGSLGSDASVTFRDGLRLDRVDTIVYATGYEFCFPFLQNVPGFGVDQNRVGPLYQHVFSISQGPSLSFVGLPWQVIPFPLMQLQSSWIARVLSGRASLPSREDIAAETEAFYQQLEDEGTPVRYTHRLGEQQWAHLEWLAHACGPDVQPLPAWRRGMHGVSAKNIRAHAESFRDAWPEKELVLEAEKEASEWRQAASEQPHKQANRVLIKSQAVKHAEE